MARTLSKREVEERLDEIFRRGGEPALQRLPDEAREIARLLGVLYEFKRFNALIGTLLRTHNEPLVSAVGVARARVCRTIFSASLRS